MYLLCSIDLTEMPVIWLHNLFYLFKANLMIMGYFMYYHNYIHVRFYRRELAEKIDRYRKIMYFDFFFNVAVYTSIHSFDECYFISSRTWPMNTCRDRPGQKLETLNRPIRKVRLHKMDPFVKLKFLKWASSQKF